MDEVPFDLSTTRQALVVAARAMVSLMPSLVGLRVIRSWAGVDAYCQDDVAIIGFAREPEGLFLATGFTGHGFCMGPVVGEVARDLMLDRHVSLDLDGVSPARFGL